MVIQYSMVILVDGRTQILGISGSMTTTLPMQIGHSEAYKSKIILASVQNGRGCQYPSNNGALTFQSQCQLLHHYHGNCYIFANCCGSSINSQPNYMNCKLREHWHGLVYSRVVTCHEMSNIFSEEKIGMVDKCLHEEKYRCQDIFQQKIYVFTSI